MLTCAVWRRCAGLPCCASQSQLHEERSDDCYLHTEVTVYRWRREQSPSVSKMVFSAHFLLDDASLERSCRPFGQVYVAARDVSIS